jgi:hypothetical protein
MWHLVWTRPFAQGSLTNLEDLRRQLTARLALLVVGASSLALWLSLPREPFPLMVFGLLFIGLTGCDWRRCCGVCER